MDTRIAIGRGVLNADTKNKSAKLLTATDQQGCTIISQGGTGLLY
jgi:hypothetical protein